MAEGQIVDTMAFSKIIFWQDFVNQIKVGQTYIFENLRVKRDKVSKQLYVNTKTKTGTVIKPCEPCAEVIATAPGIPEDFTYVTAKSQLLGVSSSSCYRSCTKSNKKIETVASPIVACNHCHMKQKHLTGKSCSSLFSPLNSKDEDVACSREILVFSRSFHSYSGTFSQTNCNNTVICFSI